MSLMECLSTFNSVISPVEVSHNLHGAEIMMSTVRAVTTIVVSSLINESQDINQVEPDTF